MNPGVVYLTKPIKRAELSAALSRLLVTEAGSV